MGDGADRRDDLRRQMAAQHTVAVHVGTPPPDFREWSRTNLYYHGFADLSGGTNQNFTCGGLLWRVVLIPSGMDRENVEEGMASILVMCFAHQSINIEYGLSFKDSTGREVGGGASRTKQFGPVVGDNDVDVLFDLVPNFAKR